MPIWAWVLIGVALLAAVLILGYVWGRKRSPAPVDSKALLEAERKKHKAELDAEKTARVKLEVAAQNLRKKQREIKEWYDANVKAIEKSAQMEFQHLSKDQAALDAVVDDLLGLRDPTKPSTPNEGS